MQRCAMQAVVDTYLGGAYHTNVIMNAVKNKEAIDAFCVFTRAMAKHWTYEGQLASFQQECHTNGLCHTSYSQDQTLFMNIQGWRVSDEYESRTLDQSASHMMPHGAEDFFTSQFPSASRFEKVASI